MKRTTQGKLILGTMGTAAAYMFWVIGGWELLGVMAGVPLLLLLLSYAFACLIEGDE